MKKLLSKINRKTVSRLVTSLAAIISITVATIAWFASNNDVSGDGMGATTSDQSNLVIADSLASLQSMTLNDSSFQVDFTLDAAGVEPARHDSSIKSGSVASPDKNSGLEYNSNPEIVDKASGKGTDLAFSSVTVGDTTYYRDYVLYLAAAPKDLPISKLKIGLTWTPKEGTQRAFSIDVYRGGSFTSKYVGTLNMKTKKLTVFSNKTIPLNTSGKYLKLILRCYFDGDIGEDGKSYIYSEQLDTGEINATISFTITEPTT